MRTGLFVGWGHCLESFFGFVRQNARADDRIQPADRIVARYTHISLEMQNLGITVVHKRRTNFGDVCIGRGTCQLTDDAIAYAYKLSQSFVALAGLACPHDTLHIQQFLQGLPLQCHPPLLLTVLDSLFIQRNRHNPSHLQ
jgi:hypothetical protein